MEYVQDLAFKSCENLDCENSLFCRCSQCECCSVCSNSCKCPKATKDVNKIMEQILDLGDENYRFDIFRLWRVTLDILRYPQVLTLACNRFQKSSLICALVFLLVRARSFVHARSFLFYLLMHAWIDWAKHLHAILKISKCFSVWNRPGLLESFRTNFTSMNLIQINPILGMLLNITKM